MENDRMEKNVGADLNLCAAAMKMLLYDNRQLKI